jgi:arginine decarboxylase
MGKDIVRTQNITQSAIGKPNLWTTVVACAVFIPLENVPQEKKPRIRKLK